MTEEEVINTLHELLQKIGDLSRKGLHVEALSIARERVALAEKETGASSDETLLSLLTLGGLLARTKNFQEASETYEKARDEASMSTEPNPLIVARAAAGIAKNELAQGNKDEAREAALGTLGVIEKFESVLSVESLSELLHDLFEVLAETCDEDALARAYTAVVRISRELDDEKLMSFIGKVMEALAWFASRDKLGEAGILADKAFAFFSKTNSSSDKETALIHEVRGRTFSLSGNSAQAVEAFSRALEAQQKAFGVDAVETVPLRVFLADALLNSGNEGAAENNAGSAVQILRNLGEVGKAPEEAKALSILGETALLNGRLTEARKLFGTSLELFERLRPSSARDIAFLLHNLGVIAMSDGDGDPLPLLERAAALRLEALGRDDFDYAQTVWALGRCFENKGMLVEARLAYQESIEIQELFLDAADPNLVSSKQMLESLSEEAKTAILPETNAAPVQPATAQGAASDPMPAGAPGSSFFPGNIAAHLMMAALLALENQNPDIAYRILREAVSIAGIQRATREADLDNTLSYLIALLEELRPESA